MTFAPHNPNAGVNTAAALHVCAGIENLKVLEHMSRDVPWGDEVIEHDLVVEDGTLEVPDEPGLGVEFDPDAAREHPGEPKDSHSLFDAEGAQKRPWPRFRGKMGRERVMPMVAGSSPYLARKRRKAAVFEVPRERQMTQTDVQTIGY